MDSLDYSLEYGTVLNGKCYDYKIVKTLGRGSFGITYLAAVQMRGELGAIDATVYVAIKEFFMHEINGRDGSTVTCGSKTGLYERYKNKFVSEATNLSKFKSQNIIKVIELFDANDTVYYAMEYIDGGSLDEVIAKEGTLSELKTMELTKQIGNALKVMHSKNMLHLDLKPSNIMMRDINTPVLIDFGLSKQFDENGNPESSTTIGGGTPGYAPIEQSNYTGKYDGHLPSTMDIYALGTTMFKMLAGHRPPEASVIVNDGFPKEELIAHNVSTKTLKLVQKAMCPTKKGRFQTIVELLMSIDSRDEENTDYSEDIYNDNSEDDSTIRTIETLIAGEQYKDAYNLCLTCIKNQNNVAYAQNKCKELIPILKQKQKKENRKHFIIIAIVTVLVSIGSILLGLIR